MPKKLSSSQLAQFEKAFSASPKNLLARNAVTRGDLLEIALDRDAHLRNGHTFSHQIEPLVKVTDQKSSGRCWIFAALNVMRFPLMKKYALSDFEFSQTYLFFWDKLEKANFFLENILANLSEELNGRLMQWMLHSPVEDGGQWAMFVNLIEKYGLVPQEAMPESYHSSRSYRLNWLLTYKLREFAMTLRKKHSQGEKSGALRSLKSDMLSEIYRILTIHLGSPPQKFDWRFHNTKNQFKEFSQLTPQDFLKKHVPYKAQNKVCLIHCPTEDKPFHQLYTVQYLGNVFEGEHVLYINLPMEELKRLTLQSLQAGEAVWFGCDVGQHFHKDLGFMDPELYDYPLLLDTELRMTKADRIAYKESCMTHAMAFTGVDIQKGEPSRWRVENSWGKKIGKEGYLSMSDSWFSEYVYEVSIDKKFLPQKLKKLLKTSPTSLPPWDPMGSLA